MLTAAQQYIEDRIERVPESGCWIWLPACVATGYGRAYFDEAEIYAHRLAWEAYRGPIPPDMKVLHHCDVPSCCNPSHLFLGTPKDNTYDSMQKKRHASGIRHGMKKLTVERVAYVLSSPKSGLALSKELGVHHSTINRIRRGQGWKEISQST